MDTISTLLNEGNPVIAIVGATDNPEKYGNRIYRDLKAKGYRVYPVNPTREMIEGDLAYADLGDLPEKPDIVDYVVPPPRTLRLLGRAKDLDLMRAWVQPGAENPEVLAYLDDNGFDYIANACIMVRSRVQPAI